MQQSSQELAWAAAVTDPMVPIPFRVGRVKRELGDTVSLELELPKAFSSGFVFAPGQFNMLYQFAVGEVPISISGDPARTDRLVHTVRAVGAVSAGLCQLKAAQTVGVRGPFGTGWPLSTAEGLDVVVLAGGLGIAPLRPAIYSLLANRGRYGNICIYYGARSPADILYRAELEKWRGRFDVTLDVTVDHADPDWAGRVGVVTKLLAGRDFDAGQSIALVCGPEIMMRYGVYALNDLGVANERVYVSMERNMKCAVGHCGHCQFGESFVCKDGPVFRFDTIADRFGVREL